MTIRIDSVKRVDQADGTFMWRLSVKGLEGEGIYFTAMTGPNGKGLYSDRAAGSYLPDSSSFEILPPERFSVPPTCEAEHVVHRVAAALVAVGWGPEFYDDRDAISSGSSRHAQRIANGRSPG
jgi:hypothetical protein